MQVEVLTLRYDPSRGVLDDTTLREFVRDKVVLAVRDHFYQVGSTPHLTLVIEYRLPVPGAGARPDPRDPRPGAVATRDLRETLAPGKRERFDLLRAWRARLAREARPASPKALLAIPGLGRRRAERYGKDLLAVVGEAAPAAPDGGGAPAGATGEAD